MQFFRLQPDEHHQSQALLPWYAVGVLDAADRAKVEAHLTGCSRCQADLAEERRLASHVAGIPLDMEQGWDRLAARLAAPPRRRAVLSSIASFRAVRLAWWGWALVGQACLVVIAVGLFQVSAVQPRFRTLAAAPTTATGNVLVIFHPDTREAQLRAALNEAGARLVDGPTVADAYLLHVPAADRPIALAKLRARAEVAMAEPVDAGAAP